MLAHARTSCVPHLSIESPTLILQLVKEAEARKLLMELEDGEKKRYQMVTVLPNGEELVWDVPGNSTDVLQAYWSFSQATERMLQAAAGREMLQRRQLQAIAPIDAGRHPRPEECLHVRCVERGRESRGVRHLVCESRTPKV